MSKVRRDVGMRQTRGADLDKPRCHDGVQFAEHLPTCAAAGVAGAKGFPGVPRALAGRRGRRQAGRRVKHGTDCECVLALAASNALAKSHTRLPCVYVPGSAGQT